ncbi:hypothetical protein Ga0102493_111159 [Erythrobacter litoralis]|uniref:Uncharacterized protein n=1 Tax=Erythrobacter litoralis TaxID=39960 RepID=A0A074MC96_9SPHN|nr:DUF6544 family protein [Erythrobacter litoralis]AOL22186.1 hypothetical protein Ga0102493_111159 [Erythrobacter litoralis]KEO91064.1 hypothetical protein EH32_01690 [Erythrobacter litoralis]
MKAALPDAVTALAERLGARALTGGQESGRAVFRQSGTLRGLGAKRWMRFSGRQWMAISATGFRWRARVGPLGLIEVEDALIDGEPTGRVRALGLVPVARAGRSRELLQGQLQRYLAELAWNPDALLSNRALDWEVKDETTLAVSARIGGVEAGVVLSLGEDGLPARTFAMRQARESGGYVLRPWHGQFSDYRAVAGRMIPHAGRVAWECDGHRFEVWRGRIEDWRIAQDRRGRG